MPIPFQPVDAQPDSLLIQRFQTGESGVFDLLYHRHHDRIHGVIRTIIYNPEDAPDLTQEVFFKAYQGLERFKNECAFSTWIYRIAVNHAIDYMRRQSSRTPLIDDTSFADKAFYDHPYHATLESEELSRQLQGELPVLTPHAVKEWLMQALTMGLANPASRRGIAVLEYLLATLTPKETALLPNYPNPFNPETWIPYQLTHDADVSLAIYDTAGAMVRMMNLGFQSAGFYTDRSRAAYWDGRNDSGETVASGVYFYRLRAGGYSHMLRMVIVK